MSNNEKKSSKGAETVIMASNGIEIRRGAVKSKTVNRVDNDGAAVNSTKKRPEFRSSSSVSLGAYLQEARNNNNFSVSQVATATKLSSNYINALERDDIDNLPPIIYIRAYVKKICNLYKLDDAHALKLLEEITAFIQKPEHNVPDGVLADVDQTKHVDEEAAKKAKRLLLMIYTVGSTAAIIVIFLIIALIGSCSSKGEQEADAPAKVVATDTQKETNTASSSSSELAKSENKGDVAVYLKSGKVEPTTLIVPGK